MLAGLLSSHKSFLCYGLDAITKIAFGGGCRESDAEILALPG